jgi:hypothetical protein
MLMLFVISHLISFCAIFIDYYIWSVFRKSISHTKIAFNDTFVLQYILEVCKHLVCTFILHYTIIKFIFHAGVVL